MNFLILFLLPFFSFGEKDIYMILNQQQIVTSVTGHPTLKGLLPMGHSEHKVKEGFDIPEIPLGTTKAILDKTGDIIGLYTQDRRYEYVLVSHNDCNGTFKK